MTLVSIWKVSGLLKTRGFPLIKLTLDSFLLIIILVKRIQILIYIPLVQFNTKTSSSFACQLIHPSDSNIYNTDSRIVNIGNASKKINK